MNYQQAWSLIRETFTPAFGANRFLTFTGNLLNNIDRTKAFICNSRYVKNILALPVKGAEGEAS